MYFGSSVPKTGIFVWNYYWYILMQLHELHKLLLGFQAQFRVALTFDVLHDIGPGYCLSLCFHPPSMFNLVCFKWILLTYRKRPGNVSFLHRPHSLQQYPPRDTHDILFLGSKELLKLGFDFIPVVNVLGKEWTCLVLIVFNLSCLVYSFKLF